MIRQYQTWQGILSVVALFVLAAANAIEMSWGTLSVGSTQWQTANVLYALTRWAFPVLTALTGSVFLTTRRRMRLSVLWKKIIPASALSCLFWWCAAAVLLLQANYPHELDVQTFSQCLGQVLFSPGYLSFCQMLVMFFVIYPLLWRISESRQLTVYCLILFFIMTMVAPSVSLIPYASYLTIFTNQLNWGYFRVWTFYLLLGVYVQRYAPGWQLRLATYCLAVIATGAMIGLTSWKTQFAPGYVDDYVGFTSPLVGLQAAGILILAYQLLQYIHKPALSQILSPVWHSAPILYVVSELTERFLPPFQGHVWRSAAVSLAVNGSLTFLLIQGLQLLPGMRCLTGSYDQAGGNKE